MAINKNTFVIWCAGAFGRFSPILIVATFAVVLVLKFAYIEQKASANPVSPQAAPLLDSVYLTFNEALVEDFGLIAYVSPHSYNNHLSPYYRIDRMGKNYSGNGVDNLCGFL